MADFQWQHCHKTLIFTDDNKTGGNSAYVLSIPLFRYDRYASQGNWNFNPFWKEPVLNLKKIALITAIMLASSGSAFANIVNGDFATGSLSGWSATSDVSIVSFGTGYAADLWAGLGVNVYTAISQSVTLSGGETLNGWAQWLGHDAMVYNDNGYVSIDGADLFTASILAFGNYGSSPVTPFSFTAPTTGTYLLTAAVANEGDNSFPSELMVGGFNVVPEPASLGLLSIAMIGMGAIRRRKTV